MKKTLPIIIFYFMSCSKNNDQLLSNLDLITSGKGKVESIIYDPPYDYLGKGNKVFDDYPLYEVCEKDNTLEFVLPSVLKYEEGLTKFDPSQPQADYGTWKLINNDKQVEINDSFVTVVFYFVRNKLVGSTLQPDDNNTNGGKDYKLTATINSNLIPTLIILNLIPIV